MVTADPLEMDVLPPTIIRTGGKIDKIRMMRMMNEGATNVEMARTFGCSPMAITNMKKRLVEQLNTFSPAMVKSELSSGTIDTMMQLKRMNDIILEELNRCRKFIDREDAELTELANVKKALDKDPNNVVLQEKYKKLFGVTYNGILKVQGNVIAIAGEVRKQVELQLKIAETLYSVSMMAEFQEEIIGVLKEVDVKVRDEVVKRLKERRQIRGLMKEVN